MRDTAKRLWYIYVGFTLVEVLLLLPAMSVFDAINHAFATMAGGVGTPAIEDLPNAFLFWRSLAHWLGGMGVIVLMLAIMPILGVGGMQLFKAEVPGPSADKLTPRVRDTAKRLWYIYVGITIVEVLLLLPAMSVFDAVNHAFATMATGGFSTRNGSVADYDSAYIDWILSLFMFLAGVNFALHYRLLRGRAITVFKDTEFRVYTGIVLGATLLLTLGTWQPVMALLPQADHLDAAAGRAGHAADEEQQKDDDERHRRPDLIVRRGEAGGGDNSQRLKDPVAQRLHERPVAVEAKVLRLG